MKSSVVVLSVLAAGALGLAGGCGDDAGTGGVGATGGATSSTSDVTSTGASTTGQGGAGGAVACGTCFAGACQQAITDCGSDPDCASWLQCAQACFGMADPKACLDGCDAPALGVTAIDQVYACACGSCADWCTAEDACGRACNDGAPALDATVPPTLADTGLYVDGPSGEPQIASYARHYAPKYKLWSDGATKERWARVPLCTQIDTSNQDHWSFPVGTRLWKEFTRDGVRIETRMIYRYGPGYTDWGYATYQWDTSAPDDPSQAVSVTQGVMDANGTPQDIPPAPNACQQCHGKLEEHVLGFGAIELTHSIPGSVDIHQLSDEGILSVPAPPQGFPIPDGGDPVVGDALGYLHANCGGCHNTSMPFPDMRLRVLTTASTPEETDTYITAVNVATDVYQNEPYRIAGGDPAHSAIVERLSQGTMPPLGHELADMNGAAIVTAWVNTLPPPN
jgi:hypothetical protein